MFTDLIYDPGAKEIIKAKFPEATFTDVSDYLGLREGRFEVEIPEITNDEFYPWFITTGYAGSSFGVVIRSYCTTEEHRDEIQKWLAEAKQIESQCEQHE